MHFTQPDLSMLFYDVLLRTVHVLFGVAWIGMLYFFNLVNVQVMGKLDGATKGKVIPVLMPRALWVFRWSALWTVLAGYVYYVKLCANIGHAYLGAWTLLVLAFYAILFFVLSPKAGLHQKGGVLAILVAAIAVVFMVVAHLLVRAFVKDGMGPGTHVVYIGVGGAYGIWMLLNVWGIIWRNQKKIIAWTAASAEGGAAIPPEAAALGRHAFLASRTNAWLSLPMLLFMVLAAHGQLMVW